MKRILIYGLIVTILVSGFGITFMALANSTEEGYDSLLTEVIDKLTPFSIGKKLRSIQEKGNVVVKSYGNLKATSGEVEFMKLTYQFTAEQRNSDKKTITTNEAADMVIKQKLLILDAESKGLVLQSSQLEQFLDSLRENYGVDENGVVNKNVDLKIMLENSNLSYDEYENTYLRDSATHDLLLYDYAKLIYEEKVENNSNLNFGENADEIVNAHLDSLLNDLKSNR